MARESKDNSCAERDDWGTIDLSDAEDGNTGSGKLTMHPAGQTSTEESIRMSEVFSHPYTPINTGWVCPQCGQVWAPSVIQCMCNAYQPYCSERTKTTWVSASGKEDEVV